MCPRLILSFLESPRKHPDEMLEALVQDTPGRVAFAYGRTIHVGLPGGSRGESIAAVRRVGLRFGRCLRSQPPFGWWL